MASAPEVGPIQEVGDARQNFTQTYRVIKVVNGTPDDHRARAAHAAAERRQKRHAVLQRRRRRCRVRCGHARRARRLHALDDQRASSGEVVWAGHRDDSFFSDIPGIFDLLNIRILDNNGSLEDGLGQDGNGVDGFKGFNVLTVAMQIPVSDLNALGHPDEVRHAVLRRAEGRRRLCER
jgi:hypothetical protein